MRVNDDGHLGKPTPAAHQFVFAGQWRERMDVAAIRERARGQGLMVPK